MGRRHLSVSDSSADLCCRKREKATAEAEAEEAAAVEEEGEEEEEEEEVCGEDGGGGGAKVLSFIESEFTSRVDYEPWAQQQREAAAAAATAAAAGKAGKAGKANVKSKGKPSRGRQYGAKSKDVVEEATFFERTGPKAAARVTMSMDFLIDGIILYAGESGKVSVSVCCVVCSVCCVPVCVCSVYSVPLCVCSVWCV